MRPSTRQADLTTRRAGHYAYDVESRAHHGRRALLLARETLSWFVFVPFAYSLKIIFERIACYRMENRDRARAQYEAIMRDAESRGQPVVFCANHLTFIDSILLLWICNPVWKYCLSYRRIFWNVPAGDVFARFWLFRWICRLNKCIFVYRDGDAAHKAQVLSEMKELLAGGSSILLFPEGRRSRTGYVQTERLTTGAARLVLSTGNARLVCAYVRADRQGIFSNYPPRHSRFNAQLREIDLAAYRAMPAERGAQLALTQAIGRELQALEEAFFNGSDLLPEQNVESREGEQIGEEGHREGERQVDGHMVEKPQVPE
jgi:1-acyl-sn-glycerol-3-phosphate acyltransferase